MKSCSATRCVNRKCVAVVLILLLRAVLHTQPPPPEGRTVLSLLVLRPQIDEMPVTGSRTYCWLSCSVQHLEDQIIVDEKSSYECRERKMDSEIRTIGTPAYVS